MSEHGKEQEASEAANTQAAQDNNGSANSGAEPDAAVGTGLTVPLPDEHGALCAVPANGTGESPASVTFLPERFVRRDTEVLARRLTDVPDAERVGGKVGDWQVVDDRGRKFVLSDEDFHYEYRENEAHGGPGKINILLPGINAIGCRAVVFGAGAKTAGVNGQGVLSGEINEWFERPEHRGLAVAASTPLPDGTLLVYVTRPFTQREIAERDEVASEVRETIDRKHRESLEQQARAIEESNKAEAEEAKRKSDEDAELRRLAMLGRRHVENCRKGKE